MENWHKSLALVIAVMVVPFLYLMVGYWLHGPQMILPAHDYVSSWSFYDGLFVWSNTSALWALLGLLVFVLVLWGLLHDSMYHPCYDKGKVERNVEEFM